MSQRVIEYRAECSKCKGTGLYVGMFERDGAAVVCSSCKGTGCVEVRITYKDFEGRVPVPTSKISRVFQTNPGIIIGPSADFGGMDADDWWDGAAFPPKSENRRVPCPAWWYQCADYDKKPKWDECIGMGAFQSCDHYADKAACWERWDREYAEAD